MRKCVVIPDSFKGGISSSDICKIIKREILNAFPECEVVCIPVADGGEGTLECFHTAIGGHIELCTVADPWMIFGG